MEWGCCSCGYTNLVPTSPASHVCVVCHHHRDAACSPPPPSTRAIDARQPPSSVVAKRSKYGGDNDASDGSTAAAAAAAVAQGWSCDGCGEYNYSSISPDLCAFCPHYRCGGYTDITDRGLGSTA